MGSKTPLPVCITAAEGMPGEATGRRLRPFSSKAIAQLEQISEALRLPVAVLFDPPERRDASIERSDGTAFKTDDLSVESVALLRAYSGVRDPAERQRLLKLVQDAAE